ncbi:serine hydrolase domain-containing protein [Streptomyces sp. NPDC002287]
MSTRDRVHEETGRTEEDAVAQGFVAAGFEAVRECFETNLRETEAGAAFAVHHRGRLVVDLWGGVADPATGRPWAAGTRAQIFSGSKGVIAAALLRLCDSGVLRLDDPIARHWPEFAAHGKDRFTVSDAVTYCAGLPAITDRVVGHGDLSDARAMARALAEQAPVTGPRLIYGPWTMGWLVEELTFRTTGLSLREYFRREIAEPHGLAIDWCLSPADEVATVVHDDAFAAQYDRFNESDDPLTRAIWSNPVPFPKGRVVWNEEALRTAYIPAANIVAAARDISCLYALVIEDLHRPDGEPGHLARAATVRDALTLHVRQEDPTLGFPFAYGRGGFRLKGTPRTGLDADMFGHDGGGGSAHFGWPGAGIALSYTPNRLLDIGNDDHRAGNLIRALKSALRDIAPEPEPGARLRHEQGAGEAVPA